MLERHMDKWHQTHKPPPDHGTVWHWMNPGFVCHHTKLQEPEFWPARGDNDRGPWLSETLALRKFLRRNRDAATITKPEATTPRTIAVRNFILFGP